MIAPEEERICIFCHTPHHANEVGEYMPLWSRSLSSVNYTLYSSSTVQAEPDQPTGASRLCLSCHDGTIAAGMLNGGYRPGGNNLGTIPVGVTNLQTDLSNDHPISFVYDESLAYDGELVNPDSLTGVVRLSNGRLECTACHDAHLDLVGKFLAMYNDDSELCETCHIPSGWADSSHGNPDVDVKCESCHTAHAAGHPQNLLRSSIINGEDACLLNCHNSSSAGADVATAFGRSSAHPLDAATGVHDPTEDPLSADYHVECADCHNGHVVNSAAASTSFIGGRLGGVNGVDAAGSLVDNPTNEYEICYKCHSSNIFITETAITRQFNERDERERFDAGNPSYHPVTALGKILNVPSLRSEYSESSRIYCSDCHNSNSGAVGVHGSIYEPILVNQYLTTYPMPYVEGNYALCWRCHDPNILLAGGTFHLGHVSTHQVPCAACHDPHGVPVSRGATATTGAHLINFAVDIVGPTMIHDSGEGSCAVSCHNSTEKRFY
jgi:predicted CXXCH cytochrome family protein